jgi:hypothetical protein
MSWNLILQTNQWYRRRGSCLMVTVPGLSQPAHIHIVSCSNLTDALIGRVLAWIAGHLGQPSASNCNGPGSMGLDGGLGCQAFGEAACRHVLVLFKGAGVPIDVDIERLVQRWNAKAGANSYVVVAVPHGEGSGDLPPTLRDYHRLTHPALEFELGLPILRAAGIGARQKLFLSYRRQDTKALADQIHEGLSRRGFQVYLDRFSWTPGRLFPEEIAEELAERGTMLLLESSGLYLSRWTQWELSFARMYHFGIIALNVNGAPYERGIDVPDRCNVTTNHVGELSGTNLISVLDFIAHRYGIAEAKRRVYFEALVRRAALNTGAQMTVRPDGLFEISSNRYRGLALPSGRPANLLDLSGLGRARSLLGPRNCEAILIGQHEHLPPNVREDVNWLARDIKVTMVSTMNVFSSVRNLIQTGTP